MFRFTISLSYVLSFFFFFLFFFLLIPGVFTPFLCRVFERERECVTRCLGDGDGDGGGDGECSSVGGEVTQCTDMCFRMYIEVSCGRCTLCPAADSW